MLFNTQFLKEVEERINLSGAQVHYHFSSRETLYIKFMEIC